MIATFRYVSRGLLLLVALARLPGVDTNEQLSCPPQEAEVMLGFGSVFTCVMEPADEDAFVIRAEAGDEILVKITTELTDINLEVLNPVGVGIDGCNVEIEQPLGCTHNAAYRISADASGEYRFRLNGRATAGGSYMIAAERLFPASDSAVPLYPGVSVEGLIEPGGDIDLFRFSWPVGQQVVIDLEEESTLSRACMALYSPVSKEAVAAACGGRIETT